MIAFACVGLALGLAPAPHPHGARSAPAPPDLGRRQLGHAGIALASSLALGSRQIQPALGDDEMRTSANIAGYTALTGEPGSSVGAGAMSGKSRPRTGVCLLEPVAVVSGGGKSITVQSLIALDGGFAATTRFDSPFPLATGMYYDVEVRNREGDGAFIEVERVPTGQTIASLPSAWFLQTVFSAQGRFGAYGTPSSMKVLSSTMEGTKRFLNVRFSALTPGGSEQERCAIIVALVPPGSEDAIMLVAGSTALRWKKADAEMNSRAIVDSFQLDGTRAVKIPRRVKSDYRFAEGKLFE